MVYYLGNSLIEISCNRYNKVSQNIFLPQIPDTEPALRDLQPAGDPLRVEDGDAALAAAAAHRHGHLFYATAAGQYICYSGTVDFLVNL